MSKTTYSGALGAGCLIAALISAAPAGAQAPLEGIDVNRSANARFLISLADPSLDFSNGMLGAHYEVTLEVSGNALPVSSAKEFSATGQLVLHGPDGRPVPGFMANPDADVTGLSGSSSGCPCGHAPTTNFVHVVDAPKSAATTDIVHPATLPGQQLEAVGNGAAGTGHWLEVIADTRAVPKGATIVARVRVWYPGKATSGPHSAEVTLLAGYING